MNSSDDGVAYINLLIIFLKKYVAWSRFWWVIMKSYRVKKLCCCHSQQSSSVSLIFRCVRTWNYNLCNNEWRDLVAREFFSSVFPLYWMGDAEQIFSTRTMTSLFLSTHFSRTVRNIGSMRICMEEWIHPIWKPLRELSDDEDGTLLVSSIKWRCPQICFWSLS